MSDSTEVLSDVLYRASSPDFRQGYDRGWDDAYLELSTEDWRYTPPLLRRFYWYPKEPGSRGRWLDLSADEYCNKVVSIRLWGGLLHIRYNRKLRWPTDGRCEKCIREEQEWKGSSDAS